MTLEEFVARVLTVPFVEKGRDFDGVDCWGVPYLAFKHVLGIELPSYTERYREVDVRGGKELGAVVRKSLPEWERVWERVNNWRPMDLALFLIAGRPVHIGLLIDRRRVLHAEKKIGVFIERIDSTMWAKRLEGVYRYAG